MEMVIGSTSYRNKLLPTIRSQSQRLAVLARRFSIVLWERLGNRQKCAPWVVNVVQISSLIVIPTLGYHLSIILSSDRFYFAGLL